MSSLYRRSTIPVEFQNFDTWPNVDTSTLSIEKKEHFEKYKAAIEAYLRQEKLKNIKRNYSINTASLIKALNRCLCMSSDGLIYGWRALIFGTHIKQYERKNDQLNWNGKAGLSGCFNALLEKYPKLESELVAHINKKNAKADRVAEAGNAFIGIYQKFKQLCLDEGLGPKDYPFNTASMGSQSLRRYIQSVYQNSFRTGSRLLGGQVAYAKSSVGTGMERFFTSERPYDTWEMDEHTLDFIGVVRISTPTGHRFIPVSRMTLIVVADAKQRCVIGYHVVIQKQANAEDIVLALANALGIWKPRNLVVDFLRYNQDAGLPSGLIPELQGACASELKIDNAMSHWSNAMTTRIRNYTGMAINWGPIKKWERRHVVESIFGILERRGFQRISSTLGTGHKDFRVDDPAGKAIKHKIEYEELLDIIDVQIANYNATPSKAFSGLSPLNGLKEYVEFDSDGFLPRRLPNLPSHVPSMQVQIHTKTIRGSQSEGISPYVEFCYARYSSPVLAQAAALIGQKVTFHVDPQEPRTVLAFLSNGAQLGILTARGTWGVQPHTLAMRKDAGQLMRLGQLKILHGEDAVSAYMRHLQVKALNENSNSKNKKKISKSATKVANIAKTMGIKLPEVNVQSTNQHTANPANSSKEMTKWPSFLKRPSFDGKAS